MINDLMFAFIPVIGEIYDITGVVDYAYGSFRIEPRYSSDISISSSVQEEIVNTVFNLYNYPNPFNPETTIYFETTNLHENSRIEIYNLKGQKIKTFTVTLSGDEESIIWDGTDSNYQPVSSGIYFYKLISGDCQQTKKMLLLK